MKLFDIKRGKRSKYEELLGYRENDSELIELAFCHSSLAKHDAEGHLLTNERLEFLGDAVIELVITDLLYRLYPDRNEGFLTMIRSLMVRRPTLNEVAVGLGIDRLVEKQEKLASEDVNGNAFEALVGAVYLDAGYQQAARFVNDSFKCIKVEKLMRTDINYKSELFQLAQYHRLHIDYKVLSDEKLPDNSSRFCVQVYVNNKPYGQGVGSSKRAAEQAASKVALSALKKEK